MKSYNIYFFFFLMILLIGCSKDKQVNYNQSASLTPYVFNIPLGLPPVNVPTTNPMSKEGVALGKQLFYDPILSRDNKMACADCHQQIAAFVDKDKQFSIGVDNKPGTRNAMPLFNLAYQNKFFWDGGAATLEDQVIGPIQNPVEMHETLPMVIEKLNNHTQYPKLFKNVFGKLPITTPMLMRAIAQFERTILSGNAKYDLYVAGKAILNSHESNGLNLFVTETKGDCNHCHTLGSTFSDFEFRNNGLDTLPLTDEGRYKITLLTSDIGKFKTPSLRNIELTAPYMHDGRFKTLEECVQHYNTGFHYVTNLDPNIANKTKGRLSLQEVADLVAFMKILTDLKLTTNNEFAR
jgi:cytochrome c peroxidase